MKKRFLPLCLSLLILPLAFLVACCEKIPIPYTQEQMYDTFATAQNNFLNYAGDLTVTNNHSTVSNSGNLTLVEKYAYNSTTKDFVSTESFDGNDPSWELVSSNDGAYYVWESASIDEFLVDADYALNNYVKDLLAETQFDIIAVGSNYSSFNNFVQGKAEGMRTMFEIDGYEVTSANLTATFSHNDDTKIYTLVLHEYSDVSSTTENVKTNTVSDKTTTLTYNATTLLSSSVSSQDTLTKVDATTGLVINQYSVSLTETYTWSTSYDSSIMSGIDTTGHVLPAEKIKQKVPVYLDGEIIEALENEKYEFGSEIDDILTLVTPKTHCTISETAYTDAMATKPYVSGSKVKSYGGDELYLFSAPQENYSTVITLYCRKEGLTTEIVDSNFEVLTSAKQIEINTHNNHFNFNESVLVNGSQVADNKFNAELNKLYIVTCLRTFEDADTSVRIYLGDDQIDVVDVVNYETLVADYLDDNGIKYHGGTTIKNGNYGVVKYYADAGLNQEISKDAMFKQYKKIYLKITPNANSSYFFIKTTKADGSVELTLQNKLKSAQYIVSLENYSSIKIDGENWEDFRAHHTTICYYNPGAKQFGITAQGGDTYHWELVEKVDE